LVMVALDRNTLQNQATLILTTELGKLDHKGTNISYKNNYIRILNGYSHFQKSKKSENNF